MKYVRIALESNDSDARPIELYAVLDESDRILEQHPAHGVAGRNFNDYCPFEMRGDTLDYGNLWDEQDDRIYTTTLMNTPIIVGHRITIIHRSGNPAFSYRITSVRQIVPALNP